MYGLDMGHRTLWMATGLLLTLGCDHLGEDRCRNGGVVCEYEGKCTTPPGFLEECIAGSDADCQSSRNCATDAKCTARDGVCVLASDADCARHEGCKQGGRCSLMADGCGARDDADCASAEACRGKKCEAHHGLCVPVGP